MARNVSVDVAVVGAGIAGCHLAQMLAERGVRVALVDKKASPLAGPTWINAVPLWMFDEAHLSRPGGREIFDINERFIIRSPDKTNRLIVDELGVADVHMGYLGKRLKTLFFGQKSAQFLQCSIKYCRFQRARLVEIIGESIDGGRVSIRANYFVDASGMRGVLKKCHPRASMIWPQPTRNDSCTASQRTLEIKDRHGAEHFLEQEHFMPGDVLSDVGIMGGYSLFRVQIDKDLRHISILCGIRALPEYKGASTVVSDFVAKHDWIGRAFIDGRGAIPLNAPYRKLSMPGLALLGDSACQVYPAHGSGIGIGLIAARYLSQSIVDALGEEHDVATLSYDKPFHKRYFERLYFSEHFRRFSQALSPKATTSLIRSGILSKALAKQTLLQEEPSLSLSDWKSLMHGAKRAPRLFLSMLPTFARAAVGKRKASQFSS